MILPFLLALLAFVALLPILAPLLRGSRPVASRASFDQAVYRDQLEELDRDIARGLITPAEAEAARLEIQRRLLATDRLPVASVRLSRSPVLAVIVFIVVGLAPVGAYLWLGAPGVPDQPFSGRGADAGDTGAASLRQASDALAAKLKQNPLDASGWLLYGRSLAMQNRWDQAEEAYQHAMDLGRTDPEVVGDHAEILVMQAGGTVTPAAQAAFQKLLQADSGSEIARYYLAIAAMQAGEPRKAIDGLQGLLAGLPADSPLRAQLGLKVAEAARAAGIAVPALPPGTGPTQVVGRETGPAGLAGQGPAGTGVAGQGPAKTGLAGQGPAGTGVAGQGAAGADGQSATGSAGPDTKAAAEAANMTDEQRQAMIRGMVANLAAKQDADPGNLDGWLRLGRAYAVLREGDKAADAYEHAAKLRPDDASIPLQELRALLAGHPPAERLPPRVTELLRRVEASDPNEPLVLWYLGLAAVQDQHPEEARGYWGRLLTKVTPGGEDARMIQSALDTLPKDQARGEARSGG